MSQPDPIERPCTGCRQLRPRLSGGYCLQCVGGAHDERACGDAVIAFVRDHPGITIREASRLLDVSPSRISQLIDEGRLRLS